MLIFLNSSWPERIRQHLSAGIALAEAYGTNKTQSISTEHEYSLGNNKYQMERAHGDINRGVNRLQIIYLKIKKPSIQMLWKTKPSIQILCTLTKNLWKTWLQ